MLGKILNKIYLIVSLILLSAFCSLGQTTIEIKRPTLSFKNDLLLITYELNDKSSGYYDIWIEIVNTSGIKINANALRGDIGPNIIAGKNKQIIWDLKKDKILLEETISVKIFAHTIPVKTETKKTKYIFQSVIWPGWGQTNLSNGKPYWLIGIAGTACLAGSFWYNNQAVNSYDQYIDATTAKDNEKYYDLAVQQDNTSKILAYSAIGIWAVNILWVALAPDKTNSTRNVSFRILPANAGSNNTSVSLSLCLNLKP